NRKMSTRGNVLLPTLKLTGEGPFIFPIPALHESLTVVPLHLRREGNWRLFWQHPFQGGFPMSTKAAEHHEHAAGHHKEAAKQHKAGHHEKAAHHAHTARGHHEHATHHATEAAKAHTEEHGHQ